MTEIARNKVLQALERYAEGGVMRDIRDDLALSGRDFYKVLRDEPALKEIYYQIQQDRADMMYDEAYEIGTDSAADPRVARVQAEIRMKIAAAYDRKRFGDKVAVELDAGPNLTEAIAAARQRLALPPCDLGEVSDADYRVLPAPNADRATDKQSGEQPSKEPAPDPLGLFDEE